MTQEIFTRDEFGNRVFIVRGGKDIVSVEGGGRAAVETTYISDSGKRSKYPTILLGVGDRIFVVGGKIGPADSVYTSAANRKNLDPTFDYVAYRRVFKEERGYMIRCVERKQPT